ncbi:MAG: RNA-binding protein [Pelatocladus maniniholoensis HA4357-MV3]|jgi:RNA recognition motif-containing protein|uniref:RNA-binding protein n=1 Tax=Pelatocladus maniniholoensis HA4357-MV3 TaxID=1117104 RepID=A0A9E3LTS1_9NOST|nr:RNA-binding protein [Pelatocladus maniniholoensis HA4357-MV3]BAZ66549.1 RNP-1 like RNA-binding protein [Fischerella sp. NIES-4106]
MSIYVGNLSEEVQEDDLKQIFSEYGSVIKVRLPTCRQSGERRGFAFVEMKTDAEEAAAIYSLLDTEFMGRNLRVNKAITKVDKRSSSHV